MSTVITVTVPKKVAALPSGVKYGGTNVVVVDNSGAKLPGKILNGTENPPWVAVFTGTEGTNEAQATYTDLDTTSAPIGSPITITETGTGGFPQTFPQSQGAGTIVVTP